VFVVVFEQKSKLKTQKNNFKLIMIMLACANAIDWARGVGGGVERQK
jgi:hypothetical protein